MEGFVATDSTIFLGPHFHRLHQSSMATKCLRAEFIEIFSLNISIQLFNRHLYYNLFLSSVKEDIAFQVYLS